MKKLLIICSFLLAIVSCKDDKIPLPTGLFVEETSLQLVAEGETYVNRVYTTADRIEVVVPQEAREWLSVDLQDTYLYITVERNASIGARNAIISLNVPERTELVNVRQGGLPTRQLVIASATCNSAQTTTGNESILASYDNDTETFWHSQYGSTQNVFEAVYTLEAGSASIDLVDILPRQYPDPNRTPNGRFTYFGIWVKGDGTGTPTIDPEDTDATGALDPADPTSGWGGVIGSVDADGYKLVYKGNAEKKGDAVNGVILPVLNPTEVKLKVAGTTANTQGGFMSLAEIAFFGKVG